MSGKEYRNPFEEVDAVNIYAGPYFNLGVGLIHYAEPYFSLVVDNIHIRHMASINFGRDHEAFIEIWNSRDKTNELFYHLAGSGRWGIPDPQDGLGKPSAGPYLPANRIEAT